jgi:thiol-disulfide isomerase/thioredoxin
MSGPDEGGGGDLDEARLDREEDGYPGPGDEGYGTDVGQRLANSDGLQLRDCDGEVRDFKEFFEPREDGMYNRGVLVNIGAGWCGPCQEETIEFAEVYDDYRERGIEFVQVLFQDWSSQAPTTQFCEEWRTGDWEGERVDLDLAFPVFIDQINDWTSIYLQDPASATPINMLVDANANIRFKSEGIKLRPGDLRTQLDLVIGAPYDVPK